MLAGARGSSVCALLICRRVTRHQTRRVFVTVEFFLCAGSLGPGLGTQGRGVRSWGEGALPVRGWVEQPAAGVAAGRAQPRAPGDRSSAPSPLPGLIDAQPRGNGSSEFSAQDPLDSRRWSTVYGDLRSEFSCSHLVLGKKKKKKKMK